MPPRERVQARWQAQACPFRAVCNANNTQAQFVLQAHSRRFQLRRSTIRHTCHVLNRGPFGHKTFPKEHWTRLHSMRYMTLETMEEV